jgi:hypothetical protein
MQKLLTVRIDADLLQELRLATVARGTTMAEIVRNSLEEWLSQNPPPQMGGKRGRKPAPRTPRSRRSPSAGDKKD